ncbi:MAG: TldD/PmbA family protein [Synergistaceae bacterium]
MCIKTRSEIETISSWALEQSLKIGASGADILYSEGSGNSISLIDGEVEECVTGENSGIGIRTILSDGRQGIAYGNRFDKNSIKDLVEWSYQNAKVSEPEEGIQLYSGEMKEDPKITLQDENIAKITPQDRMQKCLEMTEIAKSIDKRIISIRSAGWNDGWGASYYATSNGNSGWEKGSSVSCGTVVLAQDNKSTEIGGYGDESRLLSEINPQKIAKLAVEKTLEYLGSSTIKTGTYTLVIEPETTASFIEIIGDLFCSSEIHKGKSLMKDKLGKTVASSCITLIDNGRIPWKAGSGSWDSEGYPTGETTLIDKGIANTYLYNLQYAYKDGVKSTGNACRGMSSLPTVGTSNLILKPGTENRENLIKSTKKGLYVTELMGLHTIDCVTGDFSLGAKGLLIENGEIKRAVNGVTIASNIMDFIKQVVAVGSDQKFFGATATSTMVVENIVIAGE